MSDSTSEQVKETTETPTTEETNEVTSTKEEVEKEEKTETEVIDPKKALELVAQGRRNTLCGEIPKAVADLQEACRQLAKHYGETAEEVADAYLAYGRALLDLSRMESGVIGNALQGLEEEEETEQPAETEEAIPAEEREKIADEVYDAMLERDEELKKKDAGEEKTAEQAGEKEPEKKEEADSTDKGTEGETKPAEENKKEATEEKAEAEPKTDDAKTEESKTEGGEEAMEAEEGEGEEAADEEEAAEETAEDAADQSADDDVTNLQLAWEVLELAKQIYTKQESKEAKLQLAEAYQILGEVSLEKETYDQAIEDFSASLKLRQEHLESDDRVLAETYYNLGNAYAFHCEHDVAIETFQNAVNVIETRIVKANKIVEEASGKGKEPASADDPVTKANKELDELRGLLPDMLSKIEDTRVEKVEADRVKQLVKENLGAVAESLKAFPAAAESAEGEVKAADITHLVRKKRKPEEEATAVESPTKKKKVETTNGHTNGSSDAANGDKPTAGLTNGSGDAPVQSPVKAKTVEDVQKLKESASTQ